MVVRNVPPPTVARYATNHRLGDALHQQAFSALLPSPGARTYYDDALRARKIGHHAALRQLANRLGGILHGFLKTGIKCDEAIAWQHQNIAAALTRIDMGYLCGP